MTIFSELSNVAVKPRRKKAGNIFNPTSNQHEAPGFETQRKQFLLKPLFFTQHCRAIG